MKKMICLAIAMYLFVILLSCKKSEGNAGSVVVPVDTTKVNPTPVTPTNTTTTTTTTTETWQKDYLFSKAEAVNITYPSAVGSAVVVGDGTAASITRAKIQEALDKGGSITFNTGGQALTVYVDVALVVKKHGTIIDGGGLITLDARSERRILGSVDAHFDVNPNAANKRLEWIVKGFTFKNGKTTGNQKDAIYGLDRPFYATPSFLNIDGSGNGTQTGDGSAVFCGLWNQAFVVNCYFINNQTKLSPILNSDGSKNELGGAVFSRGGYNATLTVVDSYFENNKGIWGGAIYSMSSNLTVVRCGFFNNYASDYGGAIYVDGGQTDGNPVINRNGLIDIRTCVFKNNTAANQGGAAFIYVYEGQMHFTECIFENNVATDNTGYEGLAGAVRTGGGWSELRRCAFINNTAYLQGGGYWAGDNDAFSALVENCTFYGNKAQNPNNLTKETFGGAMASNGGKVRVVNTTISNNQAQQGGGYYGSGSTTVAFKNSILSDNIATNTWGEHYNIHSATTYTQEGGNIQWLTTNTPQNNRTFMQGVDAVNPLLETDINRAEGFTPILRLQSTSPAKGKGSTTNAPSVDQINKARSGRNDSGAYQL